MDPPDAVGGDRVRLRRRRQARPHVRRCHPPAPDRDRRAEGAGASTNRLRTSPARRATRQFLWDVKQEVGEPPPPRTSSRRFAFKPTRENVSNSLVDTWVPRGFAVVHSDAPGTGLSQGCPTVGGTPEELAPKAVIDWLNGRAKGFKTVDGAEAVVRDVWSTGKVGMTGTSYNGTIPARGRGRPASRGSKRSFRSRPTRPTTTTTDRTAWCGIPAAGWARTSTFSTTSSTAAIRPSATTATRTYRDGEFARGRDRANGDYNDFWADARPAAEGQEHQGRRADGPRVQRLERRARAQRPHLRGAQGPRAVDGLLPPGRPRRRSAARDDEQVVHALSLRRRERRRE